MSWDDYNEFLAAAKDLYGIDHEDAQELYRELRELYDGPPRVDDLYDDPDARDIADRLAALPDIEEPERAPSGEYSDLDDWIEAYDDGEFDDERVDEFDGGIDTGGAD